MEETPESTSDVIAALCKRSELLTKRRLINFIIEEFEDDHHEEILTKKTNNELQSKAWFNLFKLQICHWNQELHSPTNTMKTVDRATQNHDSTIHNIRECCQFIGCNKSDQ